MCSRLQVSSTSKVGDSPTGTAGTFARGSSPRGSGAASQNSATTTLQRPLSATHLRPGSVGYTQLAKNCSTVTFSSALSKKRIEEVALKLGNFQSHGANGSLEELPKLCLSPCATSTRLDHDGLSRPSSKDSMSSSERSVADKLEHMGISSLVVAATLSRLGPDASIEDALHALCHEPGSPLNEPKDSWECPVCFELQETYGWQCPDGHHFCRSCMRQHVKAVAFPRCPQVKCCYELNVTDLRLLKLSRRRVEAFENGKLLTAIETLGYDSSSGTCNEQVMHCRQEGCSNVMLVPQSDCRERFACPCGAPSFCTQCGETPYHFHATCKQVKELRQCWLSWVSEARTVRKKQAEAYANLLKRMVADEHLRQDEIWKMNNCRLCPECNRVVEKLDGCNAMKCGQDFHGGGKQAGCGATFDWTQALPYTTQSATIQRKRLSPDQGKGVYHPGISCKVCEQVIFGPRLRCIHCESFDVCADCEAGLDNHDLSHVFEVIHKAEFDWTTVALPAGMTVRIVRSGNKFPPRWHGNQFEGKLGGIIGIAERGKDAHSSTKLYHVGVRGHRGSNPEIPAEYLVPLFESRWQAGKITAGQWRQGMREPHPQIDYEAFYSLVAAGGALAACRALNNLDNHYR